jgi:3-oxoacyl-[acyl-carrier-protein] synthase-3
MKEIFSKIIATGSYLPNKILTNSDLEKIVDTSDEWIYSRSGIKKRHIISDNESPSDMAFHAANDAIKSFNINKNSIDMILVATCTPDYIFPSNACIIQNRLGINNNIPAFDLNAACSGFLYAIATADSYIKSGIVNTVLVIGSDAVSHFIDYKDRTTCVLFGDGAGAVILQKSNTEGIIKSELFADGVGGSSLHAQGKMKQGKIIGNPYIHMDGKAVFKSAVTNMANAATNILNKTGYSTLDLDWLIPHQANIRIIEATAKHLGLPMDKVIISVENHGNTAAASVPLALDLAVKCNKIKTNNLILLESFGAGFTWGTSLIRWIS